MANFDSKAVLHLLRLLASEDPLPLESLDTIKGFLDSANDGLGYSQFNEVLLILGYDRICPEFFDFLCIGSANPDANSRLDNTKQLEDGVARFRHLALFAFGNVKFAYKKFATDPETLNDWIDFLTPISDARYKHRPSPAFPLKPIAATERYYLGYLVQDELKQRLKDDPNDVVALNDEARRKSIVMTGVENQTAYLTSDYLDVYVATSMRERHEYLAVAETTQQVFSHSDLKELNLRWFDPTLAYCGNRIDKGLAEALMLKRAKCTLFLAQESDTLGKDSELACTLAQGKPVIAYIPVGDDKYVDWLLEKLGQAYPGVSRMDLILGQLRFFGQELAWTDSRVRKWLESRQSIDQSELEGFFRKLVKKHYDKRAQTLRDSHPLGLQVHLQTGVAVGVLVVRTIDACARLLKRIMLGQYKFQIVEETTDGEPSHLVLKEEISESIFRVMTFDKTLTHTFWNFYLRT